MLARIEELLQSVEPCRCGQHRAITMDAIIVERGALGQTASYLQDRGHRHVALVADANTLRAAGEALHARLEEAGIETTVIVLKPDDRGDIAADEQSLVQLLLEVRHEATSALLAVGAGTIHDLVRFAAYKMGKPFVSVPTAPSVDGFTSIGAPLIIRGIKTTVPAIAPEAIFADLDVLMAAPQPMIAAGFGDMLGKYTSLFDWKFGHLTAGEPYCEAAADITRRALDACVNAAGDIGARSEEGVRVLTNALIESGLAMLLFGQSHPASGSEHHLSHYWEMEYIRLGRKQLLHGAKVGVACGVIAEFIRSVEAGGTLQQHWGEIVSQLPRVPSPDTIRDLLRQVGGPTSPEALGIEEELLRRSLREAHLVRNRATLLKAYNELGAPASAPHGAIPILRMFDEEKTKEFYIGFLGFRLDWEHRFEPGTPLYMQLSDGLGAMLHVSEHHGDATPGSAVRLEVRHIERLQAELLGRAYKYARPGLQTTSWGTKEMCIQDPAGNKIIFYERI